MMRGYLGPSRAAPRKAPRSKPEWRVNEAYRQWVRGRACFLSGHRAGGCGDVPGRKPVEFAHVDCAGGKGVGLKVSDEFGLPLCPRHHDEQHGKIGSFSQRGGWKTFQLKYGFNAVTEAKGLWNDWLSTPMGKRWTEDRRNA